MEAVGKQGCDDDIKFNAKKSVVMIFSENKSLKRDNYIFKLNGDIVPIVEETRYLGYQLCETNGNIKHIKSRQSKCTAKLAKLKSLGLISSSLSPQSRAFFFKSYIRPIVGYGIDN